MLDIRLHLGSMLTILGLLLGGYGLFSDPAIYKQTMGINVNLWTGGFMLLLGGGFLLSALLKKPVEEQNAADEPAGLAHH